MKAHRLAAYSLSVSILVTAVLMNIAAHPIVMVNAQAATLTPVNAPAQAVPITASNIDRLGLFSTTDISQVPGVGYGVWTPFWLPDGGVAVMAENVLYPVIPTASPLELERTAEEIKWNAGLYSFLSNVPKGEAVVFSPDGKLMIGGGVLPPGRNTLPLTPFIQTWDMATGKTLDFVKVKTSEMVAEIQVIALSPDGKLLAAGGDHILGLWQVTQEGKLLPGPKTEQSVGDVQCLVFGLDSRELLAGMGSAIVSFAFSGRVPSPKLQGESLIPSEMALSPDGSTLAAIPSEDSAQLVIWNTVTGSRTDLTVPTNESLISSGR